MNGSAITTGPAWDSTIEELKAGFESGADVVPVALVRSLLEGVLEATDGILRRDAKIT